MSLSFKGLHCGGGLTAPHNTGEIRAQRTPSRSPSHHLCSAWPSPQPHKAASEAPLARPPPPTQAASFCSFKFLGQALVGRKGGPPTPEACPGWEGPESIEHPLPPLFYSEEVPFLFLEKNNKAVSSGMDGKKQNSIQDSINAVFFFF